jgi:hypothetical protein
MIGPHTLVARGMALKRWRNSAVDIQPRQVAVLCRGKMTGRGDDGLGLDCADTGGDSCRLSAVQSHVQQVGLSRRYMARPKKDDDATQNLRPSDKTQQAKKGTKIGLLPKARQAPPAPVFGNVLRARTEMSLRFVHGRQPDREGLNGR